MHLHQGCNNLFDQSFNHSIVPSFGRSFMTRQSTSISYTSSIFNLAIQPPPPSGITPHHYALLSPLFFASSTISSPGANFMLTLLTQCLSSVGVAYPSPLNTCPRWPPQFEHTISVRCIPNVLSVCLVTAPGMLSKYAGHPHPDLNLWEALYRGASQPAQV